MSYMIEGEGSTTHSKPKSWLYKYPEESHELLKILTNVIIDYLVEQIAAGAQVNQKKKTIIFICFTLKFILWKFFFLIHSLFNCSNHMPAA